MLGRIGKIVGEVRRSTNRGLVYTSAIVLMALLLLTVVDVTGRYLFLMPVKGTIEISCQMMAYVIFLGLAYTLIRGGHVRVTLVSDRLTHKFRLGTEVVTDIVGIFFCSLVLWGSWEQFWDAWVLKEVVPAAVDIVYWPSKLAMAIGFFFISIEFLFFLVAHLRELTRVSENS